MCRVKKVVYFHSFTVLWSRFCFSDQRTSAVPSWIFYPLTHQTSALPKAHPACENRYKWRNRMTIFTMCPEAYCKYYIFFARSKFFVRSNMDDLSFVCLVLGYTMVDTFNWQQNLKKNYFLIFREKGVGEREARGRDWQTDRHTNLLLHLFMHSLVDSCMCPDQGLNLQPWLIGMTL